MDLRKFGLLVAIGATSACGRSSSGEGPAATTRAVTSSSAEPAAPSAIASVTAALEAPPTPAQLASAHREQMADAARDGRYAAVCEGTPAVPSILCTWVAAKAEGKPAARPDGEVFRAFYAREHIKKVSGRIIEAAGGDNRYEVTAAGYRRHCILETVDTHFETTGAFTLWVQEQPETQEIELKSGRSAEWVVLTESVLGKTLLDLAKSYGAGVEGQAMARDAMGLIADFVTYAELKGMLAPLPDAGAPLADAGSPSAAPAAPSPLPTGSFQFPAAGPPRAAGQSAPQRVPTAPKAIQEPAALPQPPPAAMPPVAPLPPPVSKGACGCTSGDLTCAMKCSKNK